MARSSRFVALAAVVGAAALASIIPAVAAAPVHTSGPSNVHDGAFADVETAVHAVSTGDGRTVVALHARNLPADVRGNTLGAHVHVGTCGADPLTSGGHYQHAGLPAGTPLHAREIWLDLDVNSGGNGSAQAIANWSIAPGAAGSVVIHALPTDPVTGAAGARLLCTTVPFGS